MKCVSKVIPRILGVLFSGMKVPLRSTCGCKEDWCLSVVISVMDDFPADAVIRLM